MQAIGIDIGTTSICAIVLDTESGKVLKSITENSNAFLPGVADWEKIQSVDKIISLALRLTDVCITEETIVIGVTGQMHGIVYLDGQGNAVSPLYTWQDQRGNLPYGETTYADFLHSPAGYGNVTDFYNRENGIRPSNAVTYCTIHDYFAMKLCGKVKPLMHSSDAASLGCYDMVENRFHYDCNVSVTTDFAILGQYKGIPVSVAIGDNQASVFSTLAEEKAVLVNVGTGSQVSVVSDVPVTGDAIEVRPYFDGKYLLVGAAICGGRAYSLLKDFYSEILSYKDSFAEDDVYGFMNQKLKEVTTHTLQVDTRFAGTRKDSTVTGSICGITTQNWNPRELTYGVLEGMVKELHEMFLQMGMQPKYVIGSGNGIRKNPWLVKIAENVFGLEMKIPTHTEEAAVGAAMFGMVACGFLDGKRNVQKLIQYQ